MPDLGSLLLDAIVQLPAQFGAMIAAYPDRWAIAGLVLAAIVIFRLVVERLTQRNRRR
ncbi:hypothetical protein [Microbacterium rhizophilus]|uniref:hypothetical protein n=1 Tax=Microbacterium rhizophilus TaxID=3138934 RepID=UPI0031E63CDA